MYGFFDKTREINALTLEIQIALFNIVNFVSLDRFHEFITDRRINTCDFHRKFDNEFEVKTFSLACLFSYYTRMSRIRNRKNIINFVRN